MFRTGNPSWAIYAVRSGLVRTTNLWLQREWTGKHAL